MKILHKKLLLETTVLAFILFVSFGTVAALAAAIGV
jgi:hypothetical protein